MYKRVLILAVLVSTIGVSVAAGRGTSLSQSVPRLPVPVSLDAPPDVIVAGLEVRETVLKALRPASVGGRSPNYVFRLVRRWSPGETVRVAFLSGPTSLHADIAGVASQWSKFANVTFDFGKNSE